MDSTLSYLLSDHLGSTSITLDANNVKTETRYKAWGEVRYQSGTNPSDRTYTGQRSYTSDFGLMYYNARWYDSYLNHFTQADNIDIKPGDVQSLDRYAYGLNNPVIHNNPTGHDIWDNIAEFSQGFTSEIVRDLFLPLPSTYRSSQSPNSGQSDAMLVGHAAGALVAMGIGVAGMVTGAGTAVGGGIAGCAVSGCTLSVAAVGEGIVVAGYGAVITGSAANGAAESLTMLIKKGQTSGSSSEADPSESKPPSVNQLNKQIQAGQAPDGIIRVDKPLIPYEQYHVHFDDDSALNIDGTWKHGSRDLYNSERIG